MMVVYARASALSEAGDAETSASMPEGTSGSMGSHDCCKARHASERRTSSTNRVSASDSLAKVEELAEVPNSSNAMSCCPLTSGTFVVSTAQRIINENASMLQDVDGDPVINSRAIPLAILPRLPNQNKTYLRGCVFLI